MLGENLRRLRKEKQLTQSDIAAALGISRVAYTNYELGKRRPSLEIAAQLARVLGTRIETLLGAENGRAAPESADIAPRRPRADAHTLEEARRLAERLQGLSDESRRDLQSYIELLRVRDAAAKKPGKRRRASAPQ